MSYVLFFIGFQEEEESKEVVLRQLEESVNAHPDDPSLHFDLVFSSLFNLIGLSNSLFSFSFLSLCTNFSSKKQKKGSEVVGEWRRRIEQ